MNAFVRRSQAILLALALLVLVLFFSVHRQGQRLTFLAVGQGDCIVWQDDLTTVLIDAGPLSPEGYDAGERIVLPKLRKMGVSSIDLILITHPDADHIGGLRAVLRVFPRAQVAMNTAFRGTQETRRWLQDAQVSESMVVWVSGKQRVRLPNSQLYIAAPSLPVGSKANEGSLFVQVRQQKSVAILTGDASMTTENTMQRDLKWQGQVLKAGHHGSRTSTGELFLRSVQPKWAVVSCGRENRFGHPHRSVLEVLRVRGIEVLRTDRDGDVAFRPGPEGFQLITGAGR